MRASSSAVVLFAALGLLLPAARASAEAPSIGSGLSAGVAMDADGTGYVGYRSGEEGPLALCVLPPGGSACASTAVLAFPGVAAAATPSPSSTRRRARWRCSRAASRDARSPPASWRARPTAGEPSRPR